MMKNRLAGFLAILLVIGIVLGGAPAIKAQPPAPAFWLEPTTLNFSTTTTHVGYTFNETLYVGTTTDTYTWQAMVDYNSTMLNCTNAVFSGPSGAKSELFENQTTTVPGSPVFSSGSVLVGESLVGTEDQLAVANASLEIFTFQIIASPPAGGSLTSVITANNAATFLLDENLNTVPDVSFGDATFTYASTSAVTRHDVVVSSVSASSQVNQGEPLSIGVVVLNNGTVTETSINVNATYNTTLIETQTITSLTAGSTQTITFTWNTTSVTVGNYTITATVTPVTGQTDLSNISKTAKVQVLPLSHKLNEYDIGGYGVVDMRDIGLAGKYFGISEGDARWNALNSTEQALVLAIAALGPNVTSVPEVTIVDIALIARHFGDGY